METGEAEVANLALASGLTAGFNSLGSGVREMGNYEEIDLSSEKILEL